MLIRWRLFTIAVLTLLVAAAWCVLGPVRSATATGAGFVGPLPPPLTVVGAFAAPAQPWLPGNRGVDLAAHTGEPVFAAADGVVVYAGLLAGRGVVSVSHGDLRTTYEPVDALVHAGDQVGQRQLLGYVSAAADGCGPPGGCLHWGALRGETYVDPMSLLESVRIRLLPVWTAGLPTGAALTAAPVAPPVAPVASVAPTNSTAATPTATRAATLTPPVTAVSIGSAVGLAASAAGLSRLRGLRRTRLPSGRSAP